MIKTIDTDAIKQAINLIDLASNYTELRRESTHEYSGPCPWCGGNDRFHVRADYFACRQCGRNGDAIKFIQELHNVNFRQACEMLGRTIPTTQDRVKPVHRSVSTAGYFNEEKQRAALRSSHYELMTGTSADAQAVIAYLDGRGIEPATVAAFRLGYAKVLLPGTWEEEKKEATYPKQLAVALPWFNRDDKLLAVKYRFLQSHTYTDVSGRGRTENKTSRGTQAGQMFGWQTWRGPKQCSTLCIAEGEFNDMSIWQEARGAADVLSAGGERTTQHLPADVVELAPGYQRRILWADKGEIADTAATTIGAASIPSFKTEQNPNGIDANDLLQIGQLGVFLYRLGIETPQPIDPLTLVGQVISAQQLYELQRLTAALGWTLLGVRHGPVIDGYCDSWKITRAVEPLIQQYRKSGIGSNLCAEWL